MFIGGQWPACALRPAAVDCVLNIDSGFIGSAERTLPVNIQIGVVSFAAQNEVGGFCLPGGGDVRPVGREPYIGQAFALFVDFGCGPPGPDLCKFLLFINRVR